MNFNYMKLFLTQGRTGLKKQVESDIDNLNARLDLLQDVLLGKLPISELNETDPEKIKNMKRGEKDQYKVDDAGKQAVIAYFNKIESGFNKINNIPANLTKKENGQNINPVMNLAERISNVKLNWIDPLESQKAKARNI